MKEERTPWICKDCGEIAQGWLCMKCGNTPEDPGPEVRPAALQWGFLHKVPDAFGSKVLLLIVVIPFMILLISMFIPRR